MPESPFLDAFCRSARIKSPSVVDLSDVAERRRADAIVGHLVTLSTEMLSWADLAARAVPLQAMASPALPMDAETSRRASKIVEQTAIRVHEDHGGRVHGSKPATVWQTLNIVSGALAQHAWEVSRHLPHWTSLAAKAGDAVCVAAGTYGLGGYPGNPLVLGPVRDLVARLA